MAQQTESEAVFRERVSSLGLDDFFSIFAQKGRTTYGAFAFSTSSPPPVPLTAIRSPTKSYRLSQEKKDKTINLHLHFVGFTGGPPCSRPGR